MATYEELFNKLESEINLANENNQPFETCSKLNELSDLHLEFGLMLMSEMNYSLAAEEFESAGGEVISFKNCYQEVLEDKIFDEGSEELKKLKTLFDDNELKLLTAIAYSNFSTAMLNNTNRNPGLAVSCFEKAEESFNNLADKTENVENTILANYCNALKFFAEAMEDFYRTSFANAKTKFQRSKILLEKVIENELEPLKEKEENKEFYSSIINLFRSDYQAIKSLYFISDAKYQFNNRNFKNALKQFSNVIAECEFSLKNYVIPSGNEILKDITSGDYHQYLGWKMLAEAEVFRESENWDKAFVNYDLVKKEWEEASGFYLSSGHPSASALQEAVLNASLSIDIYQAVCENEKQLKEKISGLQNEIDELKGALLNAIKPMGVTVNNTQEVVTTVEQNAQFIQNIENNAREGIKELLEILKTSGLDESLKKQIESKGTDVLQSKDKGHKFLDKVKSFTKDVAEVIKNVGDIAKPLIPAFKFLALLI